MTSRRLYSTLILLALFTIAAGVADSRSGVLSAQDAGAADYATTVRVLKQKSVALNERFKQTNDCAFISQQGIIVDAITILANGEDDTALVSEMQQKKERFQAECATSWTDTAVAYRVTDPLTGKGAGSGCSSGLIAELMTLDPTAQKDYIETTGLNIDSRALSDANYVIFDISGGERVPNLGTDLTYIEAECPEGPGVNGIVLSYYLMNDSERLDWRPSIPTSIAEQVNGLLPATQQLPPSYQGVLHLPIPPVKFPIYTQEPPYWKYKDLPYLP